MTITHGNVQTYLGMNFTVKNKMVYMEMEEYLKDCIQDFPEEINVSAKTSSTKALMSISEKSPPLELERKEIFHSIVQKLLHVSKRARLDLQVTIGFLCTRVNSPQEDDWKKLKRLLQYIFGTLKIPRVISLTSFKQINI